MNRKVLTFYYIISIAFLLVLLVVGGLRIRARVEQNLAASRRDLEDLRVAALSMALAEGTFDSQYFSSAMQDNFRATARLRALAIYSPQDGLYYLLTAAPRLTAGAPGAPRPWTGAPEYDLRVLLHVRLSVPFSPGIRAAGALPEGLMLDGVFLRLSRQDMYPILRELFFVLLVYLILTTVLLLAAALGSGEPRPARAPARREPHRLAAVRGVDVRGGDVRLGAGPPESPSAGGAMPPDASNPGLYSPETGLGWRDFLPQRLSQELERAASFDQDLAFILVAARSLPGSSPVHGRGQVFRQLGKYTLESFPLRDLDFEYDDRTVAVILPDRSLDQGLETARLFQRKLVQSSWPGAAGVKVSVGVSSRSGRLISGTRLLIEASRALKKADAAGSNQIIAFRADPQKFRQALFSGREE